MLRPADEPAPRPRAGRARHARAPRAPHTPRAGEASRSSATTSRCASPSTTRPRRQSSSSPPRLLRRRRRSESGSESGSMRRSTRAAGVPPGPGSHARFASFGARAPFNQPSLGHASRLPRSPPVGGSGTTQCQASVDGACTHTSWHHRAHSSPRHTTHAHSRDSNANRTIIYKSDAT